MFFFGKIFKSFVIKSIISFTFTISSLQNVAMKLLILFVLCYGAFAIPIKNDEEVGQEHVPRFALVPDTEGRMYMADLNAELPESFFNAENDVFFILFTPENQSVGQRIGLNADQIRNSNFVASRPTRFIIHGWNGGAGSILNSNIGSAYHRNGNFNVIVVDWGLGANTINYISARNRVNEVGPYLGIYLFKYFIILNYLNYI